MRQLTSKKPQAHGGTEQKSFEGAGSPVDPELCAASCSKYSAAPAPYT